MTVKELFGETCKWCKQTTDFEAYPADIEAFEQGESYVQDLFPYLSADIRELLANATCGPCFDKMCPPDEGDD